MEETISQKLDRAMKAARGKIDRNLDPEESTKATQAVLNLMHAQSLYAVQTTQDLEDELKVVLDRVRPHLKPTDMMKASQAVLNMMHARAQADAPTKGAPVKRGPGRPRKEEIKRQTDSELEPGE